MQATEHRIGFHHEGQYLEADVAGGLPVAIYIKDVEVEPTLEMIRVATAAVRHALEEQT